MSVFGCEIGWIVTDSGFKQLDLVVVRNDGTSLDSLEGLKSTYWEGNMTLSRILNNVHPLAEVLAYSQGDHDDDNWCIDQRGLLTLSLTKETYEELGVVGTKVDSRSDSSKYRA